MFSPPLASPSTPRRSRKDGELNDGGALLLSPLIGLCFLVRSVLYDISEVKAELNGWGAKSCWFLASFAPPVRAI